jgi:hypothetical protein
LEFCELGNRCADGGNWLYGPGRAGELCEKAWHGLRFRLAINAGPQMEIINFNLMKNPLNWIIVLLMLLIFVIGLDVVAEHYTGLQKLTDPHYTGN